MGVMAVTKTTIKRSGRKVDELLPGNPRSAFGGMGGVSYVAWALIALLVGKVVLDVNLIRQVM